MSYYIIHQRSHQCVVDLIGWCWLFSWRSPMSYVFGRTADDSWLRNLMVRGKKWHVIRTVVTTAYCQWYASTAYRQWWWGWYCYRYFNNFAPFTFFWIAMFSLYCALKCKPLAQFAKPIKLMWADADHVCRMSSKLWASNHTVEPLEGNMESRQTTKDMAGQIRHIYQRKSLG